MSSSSVLDLSLLVVDFLMSVVGLSASGMGLSASVAGLSAHAQTLKGVFDILTDGVSLLLCVLWCRDCGVRYESVLL